MFYDNVLHYLIRNGLSAREFEKMCGLSNGMVHGWKNGAQPSTITVRKIAEATHIPAGKWLE